jgi:uncharacterized protein YjbI with pentapeptide repeats
MNRREAHKLLKGGPKGVAEWNRRRESGEKNPDLIWADFSGVDLSGASLIWANLSGAKLIGANLTGANLDPVTDLDDIDELEPRRVDTTFTRLAPIRCRLVILRGVGASA